MYLFLQARNLERKLLTKTFPWQVFAVIGVIGLILLWQIRRRRKTSESSPLKERNASTRVVTLSMLGLGGDASSMKSRQRLTVERSPTLG